MIEPMRFRPKARPTIAVQHTTSKTADLHRIAAWILDNGGRAWIVDNYASQGPDMIHMSIRDEEVIVGEAMWIVLLSFGNFELMDNDKFQEKYEYIQEGDKR